MTYNEEQKKHQYMVIHNRPDGGDAIVKMGITLQEAERLIKELGEWHAIGNVNNWFEGHECKLSSDSGCKICELLYNAKF